MKQANIYRHIAATALLLLAGTLAGCVNDSLDDCFSGITLRITAEAVDGQASIAPADIGGVDVYVFSADGLLLETIETEIGREETLYHPGESSLHIVAFANAGENEDLLAPALGASIGDGLLALKSLPAFDGRTAYATPGDLFRGEVDIDIKTITPSETIELPVRRMTAGLLVRLYGIQEYTGAADAGEISVVVGSTYNTLNFHGEPSYATRAAGYPVNYILSGSFSAAATGNSLFEAPGDEKGFSNILASAGGEPVEITVYRGGTPVGATFTTDSAGELLRASNGRLTTVSIHFTGNTSVSIGSSGWGDVPPIEKEI